MAKDFMPSQTRGNFCFIDQRLFCTGVFWLSNDLLLIFLCHFRPPARYSPRTQWAPGRGGPQPPTPSARSEGPNRRLFNRKSNTCNCSAVDHFSCRIILPEVVFPPSCTCGAI